MSKGTKVDELYLTLGLDMSQFDQDFVTADKKTKDEIKKLQQNSKNLALKADIEIANARVAKDSVKGIEIQMKHLGETIENQKKILSAYQLQYEAAVKHKGADSRQAQGLETGLLRQQKVLADLQGQYKALGEEKISPKISNQGLQEANTSLNSMFGVLSTVFWRLQAILAIFASLKTAINLNDQMEKWDLQMKVITHSAETAKQVMNQLQNYANVTPFKTEDIHRAGVQLLAAGVGANELMDYMKASSDWAAAMNKDVSETAGVFARLNSGDTGEALERARELGISRQNLMMQGIQFDAGGQALSSVDDTMKAVNDIVKQKFGDTSKELAATWSGMWSTFASLSNQGIRDLSEESFQDLKKGLSNINVELKELEESGSLKELGNDIKGSINEAVTAVNELISSFDIADGTGKSLLGGTGKLLKGLYEDVIQVIELLGDFTRALTFAGEQNDSLKSIGDVFAWLGQGAKDLAGDLARIGKFVQVVGAGFKWLYDVGKGDKAGADTRYAAEMQNINNQFTERINRINGVKSAEQQLEEQQKAAKRANDEALAQKEKQEKDVAKELQKAQSDAQSRTKISETELAVQKAFHASAVSMAKQRYEVAKDNYAKLSEVEEKFKAVVNGNGKEYKPTSQFLAAKKEYAEALAAIYEAEITQKESMGQYVYASEKLLDEIKEIDALGGDSTVKRYEAAKQAMSEYLGELDKIRQTEIDLWSANNNLQNTLQLPKVMRDTANDEQLSNEKYADALRKQERLQTVHALLQSEKLGAQQRKQLIEEEAKLFAEYEKSIVAGIQDAESRIDALQNKLVSNAEKATALLRKAGAPDEKIAEMWRNIYEQQEKVFNAKPASQRTVKDYEDMAKAQEQALKNGVNPDIMQFDLSKMQDDIADAQKRESQQINDSMQTLQGNLESMRNLGQAAGQESAQGFIDEWKGKFNNLKAEIGNYFNIPVTFDIAGIKDRFTQAAEQLQNEVNSLDMSPAGEIAAKQYFAAWQPQINALSDQLATITPRIAANIPSAAALQGNTTNNNSRIDRSVHINSIQVTVPVAQITKEADEDRLADKVADKILTAVKQEVGGDDDAYKFYR